MSEHKPLIPSRVAFGHGSVHQEPPGEGQHDFRPPAEPIADGCTAQRCTKCGELASEAPEFCEST